MPIKLNRYSVETHLDYNLQIGHGFLVLHHDGDEELSF